MITMNQTPQTLKGFRDFLPEEKRKRDWVQKKIVETFENFGFEPIETPTLEYASLLQGKYGDEADKLLYTFTDKGDRQVGLRYDQTVPTARVLGQYQNILPKYFRRYQIQNVFRADKPQKGRYREFTQCDIDIFGSQSEFSDAEILACTYMAYKNIGFGSIQLMINDRNSLIEFLAPFATEQISVFSLIQSLDKIEKFGAGEVVNELQRKGLTEDAASTLLTSINNSSKSDLISNIINAAKNLGVPEENFVYSPTLARGLDYYTGMIFEVKSPDFESGSLGGGGRYDQLLKDLTGLQMPAVGMAFGFDRTVEAADQLGLIPKQTSTAQVLVTVFDASTSAKSLETSSKLRQAGIKTELYPTPDKLGKQFKLANQKQIPYVIVIGQEEAEQNLITLKNMQTGDQARLSFTDVIRTVEHS